jgi:hypothetical protein
VSRFGSAHLCASPRSSDHIILQRALEIRRMASEDSEHRDHGTQAFLLVVCTGRIVTLRVPPDSPEFPAYSRMHSPPSLTGWAREYEP